MCALPRAMPGPIWRPQTLVGATRRADGTLSGGHIELARNREIADFLGRAVLRQRHAARRSAPAAELNSSGQLKLCPRQAVGGQLHFDPVAEVPRHGALLLGPALPRPQAVDRGRDAAATRSRSSMPASTAPTATGRRSSVARRAAEDRVQGIARRDDSSSCMSAAAIRISSYSRRRHGGRPAADYRPRHAYAPSPMRAATASRA